MTALMFQGTASNVGKSTLVAGVCRALKNRGLNVLPFKPLNMSNNAAVTSCGGEIGRAQALQAQACGVEPSVDMNPLLLKPQKNGRSQLVIRGEAQLGSQAQEISYSSDTLLEIAIDSFHKLKRETDIVIVEGSGSAAEVNLRKNDIANMTFARATQTPVVMLGDIELGGVIASLVGTHNLLLAEERQLVRGFIINKFRGDKSLFQDGLDIIEKKTNWSSFGVLPYFPYLRDLPAEDAAVLDKSIEGTEGGVIIAVPHLPHIANFDDIDPLKQEEGVSLVIVPPGKPLPSNADLVVIPGTKDTMHDLMFFKEQGWDVDLVAHLRRGGHVLGICGGFQILGKEIFDPEGIEGAVEKMPGLGLLDVSTTMLPEKKIGQITARSNLMSCQALGYEIHIGQTQGPDMTQEFISVDDRALGAMGHDGRVLGTYVHGLFADDHFRQNYLERMTGNWFGQLNYAKKVEQILNQLAEELEQNLDFDNIVPSRF